MSELDFKKQLLINEFKTLSKGKSNDEILPLILALSRKAQQSGISFSKDDIYLIINQVKDGLTPKEQQLLLLINYHLVLILLNPDNLRKYHS